MLINIFVYNKGEGTSIKSVYILYIPDAQGKLWDWGSNNENQFPTTTSILNFIKEKVEEEGTRKRRRGII